MVRQDGTDDARRQKYQLDTAGGGGAAPGASGRSPSQMLVECRDASGRRLCESIRDMIRIVTAGVSITRVDFFVKYPPPEGAAALFLNEVVSHDTQRRGGKRRVLRHATRADALRCVSFVGIQRRRDARQGSRERVYR